MIFGPVYKLYSVLYTKSNMQTYRQFLKENGIEHHFGKRFKMFIPEVRDYMYVGYLTMKCTDAFYNDFKRTFML